jgi:hypothetical protein
MRIHLVGSLRHFNDDVSIFERIAHIIEREGGTISQNWFSGVKDRKNRGTRTEESLDWHDIVETNIIASSHSDMLIIEGSRFNYSQGFQTAIALQNNRPVLNLYREDLPEYKEWPDKFFVSGISNPLFTSVAYKTQEDLEKIVTKFIRDHAKKTRELDVKLALTADDFEKLDQLSRSEGKSKTSLIKDILTKNLSGN